MLMLARGIKAKRTRVVPVINTRWYLRLLGELVVRITLRMLAPPAFFVHHDDSLHLPVHLRKGILQTHQKSGEVCS